MGVSNARLVAWYDLIKKTIIIGSGKKLVAKFNEVFGGTDDEYEYNSIIKSFKISNNVNSGAVVLPAPGPSCLSMSNSLPHDQLAAARCAGVGRGARGPLGGSKGRGPYLNLQ